MGSYLTVVNNTPVDWQCKVGPDTHALKVSGVIFGVVSAALAVLSITAAALALVSITALGGVAAATGAGVVIWGLPLTALSTGAGAAAGAAAGGAAAGAAAGTAAGAVAATGVAAGAIAGTATGVGLAAAATAAGTTSVLAGGASIIGGTTSFSLAVAGALHKRLGHEKFDSIPTGTSHRYGKMTLSLWQQSQCVRTIVRGPQVVVETVYMRPIFSGATANSNRNHDIGYWIAKHGTEKYTIQGNAGQRPIGQGQQAYQMGDKQMYYHI